MDLTFKSDLYDKAGYIGMLYSFLGIIFQLLSFSRIELLFMFSIFLEGFFFLFVYLLLQDLKVNPPVHGNLFKLKNNPYFFTFISHIIFIIVLINLILIGTIAIHEFGHFSIAKLYGCEAGKIVYEDGYFHTEALCKDSSKNVLVLLGGIFIPFITAIVLFFFGGKLMRDIGILIVGFNLLFVSRDLSDLGISGNLILISVFFGISFLIMGIVILAKSKVEEDIYLSPMNHK